MIKYHISIVLLLNDAFGETPVLDLNNLKQKEKDCFRLAPSSLSPGFKNCLCTNGVYGSHPAECAIEAMSVAKYALQLKHVIDFCATEKGNADTGKCFGSVFYRPDLNLDTKGRICKEAGANAFLAANCISALWTPSNTNGSFYETFCTGIGAASADCSNTFLTSPTVTGLKNKFEFAMQLCHNANTTAPITDCALDHRIQNLPIDEKIELCRGTNHDGPVRCFVRSPTRLLNNTSIIELCKEGQFESSATCADDLSPKIALRLKSKGIISLCRGAPNNVSLDEQNGPSTCAKALPPNVPTATIIETCKGAKGIEPAKCFIQSANILRNGKLQAQLCVGVEDSSNVQNCLNGAPYTLPISTKVDLCSQIVDESQIMCAQEIWNGNIKNNCHVIDSVECDMKVDLLLSLCLGTDNAKKSSQCFLQALNILSVRHAFDLCTGDIPDKQISDVRGEPIQAGSFGKNRGDLNHARRKLQEAIIHKLISPPLACVAFGLDAGLDIELAINLCDGSNGEGPIRCALSAPFHGYSFSGKHTVTLCKHARDIGPSKCALDVTAMSLTPHQRVTLCHGTSVNAFQFPVQCMLMNSSKDVDRNRLAQLCAATENLTPGHCAKSFEVLTEDNVQLCRSAVSNPAVTKLDTIQSNLPARLYAGKEFTIVVGIRDQFDQLREWDSDTLVYADVGVSVDIIGSTLFHKNSSQFFSQAQNGLASFSFTLNNPGIYSLHTCIINKDGMFTSPEIDNLPCLDHSSDRAKVRISSK